jgi:hypothetical protein
VLTVQREAALTSDIGLTSAMDEAALIRAAQQGDQDAFERLVRAYDQSVLRLAMLSFVFTRTYTPSASTVASTLGCTGS